MLQQNSNKFYSLLILLLSFFIFIFFTTNGYNNMQSNLESKNEKKSKLESLETRLTELNAQKEKLKTKGDSEAKKINKFVNDFSEDKIFLYINEYIETVNKNENEIILKLGSISFTENKKSETGFREIKIDLKLTKIKNKDSLKAFINYLTNDENKYSFFISDLNFPFEKSGDYNISLPLKMYIK